MPPLLRSSASTHSKHEPQSCPKSSSLVAPRPLKCGIPRTQGTREASSATDTHKDTHQALTRPRRQSSGTKASNRLGEKVGFISKISQKFLVSRRETIRNIPNVTYSIHHSRSILQMLLPESTTRAKST